MAHRRRLVEVVVRSCIALVLLANALAPTVSTARAQSASPAESAKGSEPRALPTQPQVKYDPPPIHVPDRFDPTPDEVPSPVPAKDQIEFSLSTDPSIMDANGLVTLNVFIRNHSAQALNGLTFTDQLETGLEYVSGSSNSLSYDSKKQIISLAIPSLAAGEALSFEYVLRVSASKRSGLWLHVVNLDSEAGNVHLKANAPFGGGTGRPSLAALHAGGGWNALGRFGIYMAEDAISPDSILSASPVENAGKGPALQFKLDVLGSSKVAPDAQGGPAEQAITLGRASAAAFKQPAFLEINLDGYVDLENIPAGQRVYVATYDEEHEIWVQVPILERDPETNTVTVQADHFSTWGAGLGTSLPQNGANVLLFDQPFTSLFTGSSRYSLRVWTPPGRAGMAPDISLSYSSGTVDGVLGDVQAPWVGEGWNMDGVEIVRKIYTNENGYGYSNDFALTLNGSLYQLVRDTIHQNRYYTDQAAFLYVERHNEALGNANGAANKTHEWWEVVTTDGTRYRLGWNADSEQLALMYGYSCTVGTPCITPNGAYATLGYAGIAKDLVALRWRVDRVRDTHGNYMEYAYYESQPSPAANLAAFDRESYLQSISYSGFDSLPGEPVLHVDPAYQVLFERASRTTVGDIPTQFNIWDNLDSQLLQDIKVCYGTCASGTLVRKYDFVYTLAAAPNANGTLTLASMATSGGGYTDAGTGLNIPSINAPKIRFTYGIMANRAVSGTDPFNYPRLTQIDNGASGKLTFTYETDGRGTNSWYNYRVKEALVESGMGTAKYQSYTYGTAVYAVGSNNLGALTGYPTVSEKPLDFQNGNAVLVEIKHTFGTTGLDIGRELQTEWLSGTTVLRKSTNTYVTDNSKAPFPGWNYRYLYQTASYEKSGSSLLLASTNTWVNDPATGNLVVRTDSLGSSSYRKTYYEYLINPSPERYILDKATRALVADAGNTILSDVRYHYDGTIHTAPTKGELTLVQRLTGSGSQTVDSGTHYDVYGNADSTQAYKDYGTINVAPGGAFLQSSTVYDDTLHSYPVSATNPLNEPPSSSTYLYTLGVPYQSTDANGWTTTTTYDGLGRTVSVRPAGLSQPGVWYSYPVPDVSGRLSAPYSVEMQILDTIAQKYRSVWGIYDGLGRMLQTQVEAGAPGLLVTTSQFNAAGAVKRQSLPYYVNGAGGNYIYNLGSQFTDSLYDALGRATQVTAPGNIITQTTYDGLTTTAIDPDGHKVSRTADGLGRMAYVMEYQDSQTVYATTRYFYDAADRLIQVTDAQANVTAINYDWLGRKTGMDDPDMGIWTYVYDPVGTLHSQTDARNQELTFGYDDLNRLTGKSDVTNIYGSTVGQYGFRIEMIDASGSASWSYADFGRTVTESRTIGSESNAITHAITTRTDWLGRAISTTYDQGTGSQEVLTYQYDSLGRPLQMKSDQDADPMVTLAYNVLSQITTQTLGNPISPIATITNTYDSATNRLSNHSASSGLLNLSYVYDPAGNITRLTDSGLGETHFYQYDALNRLTSAIAAIGTPTAAPATPQIYGQQFQYDKIGDILQVDNWTSTPSGYQAPQGVFNWPPTGCPRRLSRIRPRKPRP